MMRTSIVFLMLGVSSSAVPLVADSELDTRSLEARMDTTWALTEWRNVKCDYGSLKNAMNDPIQQWQDSKAAEAYGEAWNAYKGNKSTVSFGNWLGNYFNARPGLDCGDIPSGNCEVTVNCGQADTPNAPVNSPAGYLIVTSMVSLHIHYQNMYEGLMNAYTFMLGQIPDFTSIFAPQLDQMKSNKILIDVSMMLFAVISAGTFNSWLKNVGYFDKQNGNTLGVLKDTTNAFVNQGINTMKDSMSAVDDLRVQNSLDDFLSTTVQTWVSAIGNTTTNIFDKDPAGLFQNIVNGKVWDMDVKSSPMDVTADVQKTLYAYVTPYAWKLANTEVGAFIATNEGIKGTVGDCNSYDPKATLGLNYNGDWDILPGIHFCDDDNNAYWLINMHRSNKRIDDCSVIGGGGCAYNPYPAIESLPGIDHLDGSKWGGLRPQDLALSAIRAWKGNNKKNGWAAADASTPEGLSEIYDNGLNATGVVNIPICSFTEAYHNAYPNIKTDNWPCN